MLSTPRQIHALALYCLHRHRSIYTVRGLTERYEYKTKDHRIVAHFADGRVRPLSMHNHVILRTATKTRSKKDVPVTPSELGSLVYACCAQQENSCIHVCEA